jgi:hypothetical protein
MARLYASDNEDLRLELEQAKQRRTLKQIHEDLKELGFEGSYDRVAAFARYGEGQIDRVNSASKRTIEDSLLRPVTRRQVITALLQQGSRANLILWLKRRQPGHDGHVRIHDPCDTPSPALR